MRGKWTKRYRVMPADESGMHTFLPRAREVVQEFLASSPAVVRGGWTTTDCRFPQRTSVVFAEGAGGHGRPAESDDLRTMTIRLSGAAKELTIVLHAVREPDFFFHGDDDHRIGIPNPATLDLVLQEIERHPRGSVEPRHVVQTHGDEEIRAGE